jgi:HEAT repeat protein
MSMHSLTGGDGALAAPVIRRLLDSPWMDPGQREIGLQALARLDHSAATRRRLIAAAERDPENNVRVAAVRMLAAFHWEHPATVDVLYRAASDGGPEETVWMLHHTAIARLGALAEQAEAEQRSLAMRRLRELASGHRLAWAREHAAYYVQHVESADGAP